MALVVEDGTGKSDAESYLSVADFKTYADGRGYSYAGTSDSVLEQKLRLATGYIDTRFRFKGDRMTGAQALEFPRSSLIDWSGYAIAGVPQRLKQATAELCFKAISDALYEDQDRGGMIKSEKVGSLSVDYADGAPTGGKTWTFAFNLLSQYVRDKDTVYAPFAGGETKGYFHLGMMDAPNTSVPTE